MRYIDSYNEYIEYFITEGLISSAGILKAQHIITRFISQLGYVLHSDIDKTTDTLFIKFESIYLNTNRGREEDIFKILSNINSCGYFVTEFAFYDKHDNYLNTLVHLNVLTDEFLDELFIRLANSEYVMMTIETKFNKEIKPPKFLYHLTLSNNYDKIKRKGLIPKTENKRTRHLDRIYFRLDKINTKGLAKQFGKGEYILLEINTDELRNDKGILEIKFYDDPDFSNYAVYTYENIKPSAISKIEDITII